MPLRQSDRGRDISKWQHNKTAPWQNHKRDYRIPVLMHRSEKVRSKFQQTFNNPYLIPSRFFYFTSSTLWDLFVVICPWILSSYSIWWYFVLATHFGPPAALKIKHVKVLPVKVKVYDTCMHLDRYLSKYNNTILIPSLFYISSYFKDPHVQHLYSLYTTKE